MDTIWVAAKDWKLAHLVIPVGKETRRLACGRKIGLQVLDVAPDTLRRCTRCIQTLNRINTPPPKPAVVRAISTDRLREFVEHLRNTGRDSAADELEELINSVVPR